MLAGPLRHVVIGTARALQQTAFTALLPQGVLAGGAKTRHDSCGVRSTSSLPEHIASKIMVGACA